MMALAGWRQAPAGRLSCSCSTNRINGPQTLRLAHQRRLKLDQPRQQKQRPAPMTSRAAPCGRLRANVVATQTSCSEAAGAPARSASERCRCRTRRRSPTSAFVALRLGCRLSHATRPSSSGQHESALMPTSAARTFTICAVRAASRVDRIAGRSKSPSHQSGAP